MTPGELFTQAVRVVGFWTIVTAIAEISWAIPLLQSWMGPNSAGSFGTNSFPSLLVWLVRLAVLTGIGFLLVSRAPRIAARYYFEPDELKRSGQLQLDSERLLSIALRVMGLIALIRCLPTLTASIALLGLSASQSSMGVYGMAEVVRAGLYFITGIVLFTGAESIAHRFAAKSHSAGDPPFLDTSKHQ